jgi:tRNA threonylcarbamoyladenosine biosynthesis protein TsaE
VGNRRLDVSAREDPPVVIQYLPSVAATTHAATRLAGILGAGDLVLFTGGIGSGKTTFVKAMAAALGVQDLVTSPSFVLHAVYPSGRVPLSHVDLYRLENAEEVESIGFEDYLDTSVTAVEWADRYAGFEAPYLIAALDLGLREDERMLTITPTGGDWIERLRIAFPASVI